MPTSSKSSFPYYLTKILYALLICPMHATLTVHLVPCDLTTLIIYDERYKLWSSSYAVFINIRGGWTWPPNIKYSVCAFVQVVYTKKLLPEIYCYLDWLKLADFLNYN